MSNPICWQVKGITTGRAAGTSAVLTCAACKKGFEVQASTLAGAFVRLQMIMSTHLFEEHSGEPQPRPATTEDTLRQCGYRGYRQGDGLCHYERGHEGPCQWSQD